MGQKVKGGLWCPQHGPVLAVKNTHGVRNAAGVGGILATGGLSLLLAKTEPYVCPHCGGPVRRGSPMTAVDVSGDATLTLTDAGPTKIAVIKTIRTFRDEPLKTTKALVDHPPSVLAAGISEDTASQLRALLEQVGATVQVDVPQPLAPVPAPEEHDPPPLAGITADLERLAALRDTGALTETEFAAAKARVLVVLCYSSGVFGSGRSARFIGRWQVWQ